MAHEVMTAIGWIVGPAIAGLVGAWAWLHRRVADHDVRLGRHEMQIATLDEVSKRTQETQRHIEDLMREILQRIARVEQRLEDIKHYLNGKER